MEPHDDVAVQYARFADEAEISSACFAAWARAVAGDPEVLAWVDTLPGTKKQPNLVFAAARWHGVPAPGSYAGLRDALLADDGSIRATIMSRATQTNEAGRLATLLPAFAMLGGGGPLALIEVGASAGLTLYPDRWGYTWSTPGGMVELGPEPRLACEVTGPAPLPSGEGEVPAIAWRAGLDLHPLDVTDTDATAWLEALVWPEEDERRERLRHALNVARQDPPRVVAGDLLTDLAPLVAEASSYGTVVVFHSAVMAYLEPDDRVRARALLREVVTSGAGHWVSNEAPRVFPDRPRPEPEPLAFELAVDDRVVAWTHGHGRFLHWVE